MKLVLKFSHVMMLLFVFQSTVLAGGDETKSNIPLISQRKNSADMQIEDTIPRVKQLVEFFDGTLLKSGNSPRESGNFCRQTEQNTSSIDDIEPSYCRLSPEEFIKKYQVSLKDLEQENPGLKLEDPELVNLKVFKMGDVVITGVGVGKSNAEKLAAFVSKFTDASAKEKYCTWYLNSLGEEELPPGKLSPEKVFHHTPVEHNPKRKKVADEETLREFRALSPIFDSGKTNFLSCAENHKFIAMGCNGMRHRGPSVFAMTLAFSGCKDAAMLANGIWGLNGVPENVRADITKIGYDLGQTPEHSESRRKLSAMLMGKRSPVILRSSSPTLKK